MSRTKLAVKRLIFSVVSAAMMISLVGCSQLAISPIDQLATMRPVFTPGAGRGGAEPFVPVSDQPTKQPTKASTPQPTAPPKPTAQPKHTEVPQSPTPTPGDSPTPAPPILYYTQAGDTLKSLALRFGVAAEEISSPEGAAPVTGLLNPGQLLLIPNRLSEVSNNEHILPDSEIVYSPSAIDFNVESFIKGTGGYLETYKEWRSNGRDDAANTIIRVAIENSINPRLLLAILEYQGHWVYETPSNLAQADYPLGHVDYQKKGLYAQLSWSVQMLNIGYYGWRDGRITQLTFVDGSSIRLAPDLNAGTVALLYLFSQLYDKPYWAGAMYGPDGLPALYKNMFGDPWERALAVEPLFPATLTQPPFDLPFAVGRTWSHTGGPHSAWGPDGALASLDFAPSTTEHGCYASTEYVTAMASGLVVRSETGVVVVDLDGDGTELTGWNVIYLHIATDGRPPVGTWINIGEPVGYPSCEGGQATGTHVHISRKYNGEWIQADGPMPFELSGWIAHQGDAPYVGTLTKDGQIVQASRYGEFKSLVTH